MKLGDLVSWQWPGWSEPGIIVRGPYGAVIQAGKTVVETKVADVLVGKQIFDKIPISQLQKITRAK